MQSDEFMSDDDKLYNPRETVVLHPTVSQHRHAIPMTIRHRKRRRRSVHDTLHEWIEFYSSFEIFDNIDDDLFNEEQPDKVPFHDSIEKDESQKSKDELERASSVPCSLQKLMIRPIF